MAEDNKETQAPTPTPSPTALPPNSIVVSADEWNELRATKGRLEQIERDKQAEIDAKEAERLKAVADKEGAQAALDQQRALLEGKLSESEQRAQRAEQRELEADRAKVISNALSGVTFSGETPEDKAEQARQLRFLLEQEVEAVRDRDGKIQIRDRVTGRPAEQVIRETLEGRKYASFMAPKGGKGTGGGNGDRTTREEEQEKPPEPGTLAYEVALREKQKINSGVIGLRRISG